MSGIIVSVIVPFLESNNKLIDTLSSISEQKNINQENIEVLIVDATDKTSGKIASGSMSMCKVIYAKSVKSFADACNLAASKATGKYPVFRISPHCHSYPSFVILDVPVNTFQILFG